MNQTSSYSGCSPLVVFLLLFSFVFFAVVITATLIAFIMPETYAGTTRIVAGPTGTNSARATDIPYFIQTQFEIIRSELVLGKVSEALDLNTVWGKRYANGEKLKTADTVAILKARMRLQLVNNTSIMEIRVLSEDRDEAATIANKIAQVFAEYARSTANGLHVEIVDVAHPSPRPTRPNKRLNIPLGMVVGAALGALAGGAGAAVAHWRRMKSSQLPAIP